MATTRVYISSRIRNRGRCREYRDALEKAGIEVTSRWLDIIDGTHVEHAERDLFDCRRADVLLLVGHCGRNGGMATELGIALERGMRVIHVASDRGDNVFTHVPGVEYHRTFRDALRALTEPEEAAA